MSTQPRTWSIHADPLVVGLEDQDIVYEALTEITTILTRIGGAVIIAADREQIAPGMWQTTGLICKWESFVPGKRLPDPEPEPHVASTDDNE